MTQEREPRPQGPEKITIHTFKHSCTRCGAVWSPRIMVPQQCPYCHSPYWNKPRKYISMKLRKQLESLAEDTEVQKVLQEKGILFANFITKKELEKRRKQSVRYYKRKQANHGSTDPKIPPTPQK